MRHNKILKDKKVLLIALPGYSDGILKKLEEMGASVDYIKDKPRDSFLGKTLGRMQAPFYIKYVEGYYKKKLFFLKHNVYNYILVIRGEYTPSNSLKLIKELFPTTQLILYMWDSIVNNKFISKKWDLFDNVYTFDRMDYLNNKDRIKFLPLFYYENYLPNITHFNQYQFDLSFVGTVHEDRYEIVTQVCNQIKSRGGKTFSYFYSPHKVIFWLNKLKNKYYKKIRFEDVSFELMSFEKLYDIYGASKCIIDIESSSQTGLTMRTIEIIGLRKKLITTNNDIKNYDFYNPNNILIINRKKPQVDFNFLNQPYQNLADNIYYKYSLEGWLLQVFGIFENENVL
ncbi:hypothetical protein [Streptococcus porcinus]